jgi:raffinose/stachyose/melibiose transport system substrate-binding protein
MFALGAVGCSNGGGQATNNSGNGGGQATNNNANGGGGQGTNNGGGQIAGTNLTSPLEPAYITWVHNGVNEPLRGFWQTVADEFMADHPGVNVTVQPVQNETLRNTVLPTAFHVEQGNDSAPDLFQSWGGGELRDWANQGVAWDITQVLAPTIANVSDPVKAGWAIDAEQYGLPYTYGPAGFWVNLNALNDAGLVQDAQLDASGNVESGTVDWPTDISGLFHMWASLSDHNITPVAVGGGDNWPAAWWWYAAATKTCSPDALSAAGDLHDFSDPCWVQAGDALQEIMDHDAFNSDWQTTGAQVGADSAAGRVASGAAAMELTGPWGGRAMADAVGDNAEIPGYLAWYPFPPISGRPGVENIMAGGDGFSVLNPTLGSQARSDAAAALLAYIMSDSVQARFAETVQLAPTNTVAGANLSNSILANQYQAISQATYVVPWFDVLFGTQIATPMNQAINELMAGQGAPQGLVDTLGAAAGN